MHTIMADSNLNDEAIFDLLTNAQLKSKKI